MTLYEKCQNTGDKEIHDDYVYIGQTSSGSIELPLTGKQIKSICTTGDNDVAVDAVVNDVKVQEWLGKYSDGQIKCALEEYGNWSDKELTDLKSNKSRLVWMMAWDIFDSEDPNENLAIDEMQHTEC